MASKTSLAKSCQLPSPALLSFTSWTKVRVGSYSQERVGGKALRSDRRLEQPDQAASCVWNPQREKKD